jgi:MFS family permease
MAVFPLFVAGLLRAGGTWHAPFLLVAGLFAAYARATRRWRHIGDPPGLRLGALGRLVRGRAGAALVVACLGTGVMFAVPLWIPTLLRDRFGWSTAAASLGSAVYMVSLLAVRVTVASLAARVDGRRILLVCSVLVVLGHIVLFLAWSPAILLVAAATIAIGAGPLLPVGIARVAQWSGDDRLGTAAVMGLAALSQIVFPALVVGVHAAGMSLQHAAAVTVLPALLILAAARRA